MRHERQVFEAGDRTTVVTLPGEASVLPVEFPERIAELTVAALAQVRRGGDPKRG